MAAADLRRAPADAGAEKWAVPAPDDRARDAWSLQAHLSVQWERPAAAAELCTLDAVQSAEQSCAAPEAAAGQSPQAQPDAVQPREAEVQPMPKPKALPAQAAQSPRLAAARDAALPQLAARWESRLDSRLESQEQRASPPREQPLPAARQALELSLPELKEQREAASVLPPEAQRQVGPPPEALRAAPEAPLLLSVV
jgi:hypothetical protein